MSTPGSSRPAVRRHALGIRGMTTVSIVIALLSLGACTDPGALATGRVAATGDQAPPSADGLERAVFGVG